MGSVTSAAQKRRLLAVVDVVRALGGSATIAQIAERLEIASLDGVYYRVTRAVNAKLLVRDEGRGAREAIVVRLPPVAPAPEAIDVYTSRERTEAWVATVMRAIRRRGSATALDIAAYLNLPSVEVARRRMRSLVLDGTVAYDASDDSYREAAGRERAA
jgi:hypothetical protein